MGAHFRAILTEFSLVQDKSTVPLTVKQCENFKPLTSPYKRADGNGLYLEIQPSGSKYWRLKYRFGGSEKRLAIGVFPEVSLSEARDVRDTARRSLRMGIDPSAEKKARKAAARKLSSSTFLIIANQWYAHKSKGWSNETARKARMVLDTYLFPKLGRATGSLKLGNMLNWLKAQHSRLGI